MFGIGEAVKEMRNGHRVQRAGWNGKGVHVELVTTGRFTRRAPTLEATAEDLPLEPHVVMLTAQGTLIPWLCSQADLLAVDWQVVPR